MPEELRSAFATVHRPSVGVSNQSPSMQDTIQSFEARLTQLENMTRLNPHIFCDFEGGLNEVQEQYLEIQSVLSRCRQEPFDKYKTISKWHCTEAFAALLTEHFRRAKKAVIQSED